MIGKIRPLLRWLPDVPLVHLLYAKFRANRRAAPVGGARLLVQCVEDPFYYGVFGALCGAVREIVPVRVDLFVLRSLDAAIGSGFKAGVLRNFIHSSLMSWPWIRAYRAYADGVGYRSISLDALGDVVDYIRARRLWRGLRSARHLDELEIGGIQCGDLVIDTYLRFRPSAELDIRDSFVFSVIWQACRDIRRAEKYFESHTPLVFLTSYTTYVQHGIAARVALRAGVPVFSFGNFQEVAKRLSRDDPYHTKNPAMYREDFAARLDKKTLLAEAKEQLGLRLSGGVDTATAYMATSAYAQTTECPDVNGAVVVFLHDFFDSPHIYPDMIFVDFWEWVCHTVATLQKSGQPFFLKPHPNQVDLSSQVIQDLKRRFKDLKFIPSGVSNTQLAGGGMACGVTVYGTVAHEIAYLGVPCIASARHPHVSFDFCQTARSRAEYDALLLKAASLRFADPEAVRDQVLAFYAMHNLAMDPEQRRTRDLLTRLRGKAADHRAHGADRVFLDHLFMLKDEPGFVGLARQLAVMLENQR